MKKTTIDYNEDSRQKLEDERKKKVNSVEIRQLELQRAYQRKILNEVRFDAFDTKRKAILEEDRAKRLFIKMKHQLKMERSQNNLKENHNRKVDEFKNNIEKVMMRTRRAFNMK